MPELMRITKGGFYNSILLTGKYDDIETDGVIVDAPDEVVFIKYFNVSCVRVPLIVKRCKALFVGFYDPSNYWGDTANFRTSHIYINHFRPYNIVQRLDYDRYHQDLIFQAYAVKANGWEVDPDGCIEHIHINNVHVESELIKANGIMLSEACRYRHIHIGTESLRVRLDIPFWLNANTLEDSVIGGMSNDIAGFVGDDVPVIRLANNKGGSYLSQNNCFSELACLMLDTHTDLQQKI